MYIGNYVLALPSPFHFQYPPSPSLSTLNNWVVPKLNFVLHLTILEIKIQPQSYKKAHNASIYTACNQDKESNYTIN